MRAAPTEYAPYFERYVSLVPEDDVLAVLAAQAPALRAACRAISAEAAGHRYAPDKWTVREVVGHVIDAERVFGYRALCMARGETLSLPSFDENAYAAMSGHEGCSLSALGDELALLRESHVHMFRHMSPEAFVRVGRANDRPLSARASAYIIAGHLRHHTKVVAERYGVELLVERW